MAKRTYDIKANGEVYRLRLTLGGQRMLRRQFDEDTLETVLGAAVDGERMAAVLQQALNWDGNDNRITDGEALYDLLVDCGWSGQEAFGALAFEIAAESGLISREQAEKLKATVKENVVRAFDGLGDGERKEADRPTGNP